MAKIEWNPMDAMPDKREYEVYHVVNEDYNGMPALHAHHHYEIYFYLTGSINISVEEKLYQPDPYTLFIYPPGVLHRWLPNGEPGRYERVYAYLSREFVKAVSTPDLPMDKILDAAMEQHRYSVHLGHQTGAPLVALIDEIIQNYKSSDPADLHLNRCRIYMLLINICRLLKSGVAETTSLPMRVKNIIAYINEHITEAVTLDTLTERFFVSKYYLLHTFKEYTGMSVHQYIINKRISHAQSLMHGGMQPGDAAQASGFNDYAGFYRAFTKLVGVTPQAFSKGQGHKFFRPTDDRPSNENNNIDNES